MLKTWEDTYTPNLLDKSDCTKNRNLIKAYQFNGNILISIDILSCKTYTIHMYTKLYFTVDCQVSTTINNYT